MKQIYTSNYARNSNNPKAIGISLMVPPWYNGERMEILAPTREMIEKHKYNKAIYNDNDYSVDYIDLLKERNLTPELVLDMIPDGSILLCYEKPYDFCHRRVLAEWIEYHTGNPILEWKNEKELRKEKQNKVVDNILDF